METVFITKPVYKILCSKCATSTGCDITSFFYTAQKTCIVRNVELVNHYTQADECIIAIRKSEIILVRVGLHENSESGGKLKMNSGQQLEVQIVTHDERVTENTIKLMIENRNYGE